MKSNDDKTFYWAPWHNTGDDNVSISYEPTDPIHGYSVYVRKQDGEHIVDDCLTDHERVEDAEFLCNYLNNREDERQDKHMVNGFADWHETHFEVVQHIIATLDNEGSLAHSAQAESGHGGLYQLAEDLTNAFELTSNDTTWDGEWFDAIEEFLNRKEAQHVEEKILP